QVAAADVAKVDVEDFLPRPEVADGVEDLLRRILQAFRNRALAEIEAVIGARADLDELLQPLDAAEDAADAAETVGQTRVVRMAGDPDLVLLGDRDDAVEEIGDARPDLVGGDAARFGGLVPFRLLVVERAVARSAPPRRALGADDAEHRQ